MKALLAGVGGPHPPHAAQVHFPFPAYGNKLLAEALGQAVDEGLCRAVGVCNFGADGMQELHGLLVQRGVALATNQARTLVPLLRPKQEAILQHLQGLVARDMRPLHWAAAARDGAMRRIMWHTKLRGKEVGTLKVAHLRQANGRGQNCSPHTLCSKGRSSTYSSTSPRQSGAAE